MNEKDPTGKDQHEFGAKLDDGKVDCSLLGMFGRALLAVSEVGTYGAKKYTRGGWQHVKDGFNRYTAAMFRHYFMEQREEYDQDLPVRHAAQVAWNALARLELLIREGETNERTETETGNDQESSSEGEKIYIYYTSGTVQGTDSRPEKD